MVFLFLVIFQPFPNQALCFVRGDINSDGKIGLDESIYALRVTAGLTTAQSGKVINVPADFPTIQEAIDAASEGDTINAAAGSYSENVLISKDNITLQGAGAANTVIDGGGEDVIVIQGGKAVTIKTLTVRSGNTGIIARRGATFEVRDILVQDCSTKGIQVDENSTARIADSKVMRNGDDGILVFRNSSVTILGMVESSNNTRFGFHFLNTSNGFFYGATITANDNGRHGIMVSQSSSLTSQSSTVTVKNNTNDGVCVLSASALDLDSGSWITENNNRCGLNVAVSSSLYINTNCSLISRQNKNYGMEVAETSNAEIGGTVLIDGNGEYGMFVFNSSSLGIADTAKVTVTGTTGGYGVGISVLDSSSLNAWGGTLVVENSAGTYGHGVWALRGSNVEFLGTNLSVEIRNNGGSGVQILQNSSGRFGDGTVIHENAGEGILVYGDSMLDASDIRSQNNGKFGISSDGSTIAIRTSTISGNTGGDVNLLFGSRSTLTGNTIGTTPISCDGTVLSRGTHVCP